MSATPASSTAGPLPDFAGVYVAKPQRILIGPLVHLDTFLHASCGATFPGGDSRLPPPALRYVVDCAPHLSDLPPMPDYAMMPSSVENASSAFASPVQDTRSRSEEGRDRTGTHSALSTPPSQQLVTPTTTTTSAAAAAYTTLTTADNVNGGRNYNDNNSNNDTGASKTVCPATMSLFSAPGDDNIQVSRETAAADDNSRSCSEGETTPSRLAATTTPATTSAIAAMSTTDVVRRMNRNAEECLARLRQRCVQNGMSTAAFSSVRQANPSPIASSFASLNSSPMPSLYPQLSTEVASPPVDTNGAEGKAAADVSAGPAATKSATETDAAAANSAEKPAAIAALPKAKVELFAQARLNDEMRATAAEVLGAEHVLRCLIPNTDDSLATAAVQDTIARIHALLEAEPEAQVYIYSLDGKGTASALAALYLLQVDQIALSEVLLNRLPVCTPRMSCLVQLVERDPHPESFDKAAYLRLYLARRYPSASAASIEAAVSTCRANYTKAERLVRLEMSFHRVDGAYLPSRDTRRSGSGGRSNVGSGHYLQSLSNMSSLQNNHYNPNTNLNSLLHGSSGSARGVAAGAASGAGANGRSSGHGGIDGSISEFSLCSSFARDPMRLTDGDDKIIDSLYRALADSRVGVSRDDVKESYIQHRRSQDLVLRQFLLRIRPSDVPATPPRIKPYHSGYSNLNSGCVTPTTDLVEEISLPHFEAQSASRRGSAVPGSATPTTATKKVSATESCPSPEPTMPSVNAAATPTTLTMMTTNTTTITTKNTDTPIKMPVLSPCSSEQPTAAALLATPITTSAPVEVGAADAPAKKSDAAPSIAEETTKSSAKAERDASAPVKVKKVKKPAPGLLAAAAAAEAATTPRRSAAMPKTKSKASVTPKAAAKGGRAEEKTPLTPRVAKATPKKKKASPKASSSKSTTTTVRA